jgi:hypothetical protein
METGGSVLIGFIWLRTGTDDRVFEHENGPLGSIDGGEFLAS